MTDLIPTLVDGAVILDLQNGCKSATTQCQSCLCVTMSLHNWLRQTGIEYLIIDLQDEKEICPLFLEEVMFMRRRVKKPFLFAGVMERPQKTLDLYNNGTEFPTFVTPEDAVRAVRIQFPGITEKVPNVPFTFGEPLSNIFHQMQGEVYEFYY